MSNPSRLIEIAKGEVGYHEGYSNGHWNNIEKYAAQVPGLEWANGQPWCAVFVSWLALQGAVAELYPRTASCDTAGSWFKAKGQWSDTPLGPGDQVFYGTPGDLNHTGVLVSFDALDITTIEGNTNADGSREGDGVYLKARPRRGVNIIGYGHPAFVADAPEPKPTLVDRIRAKLTAAIKAATPESRRQRKLREARSNLPKH